MSDLTPEEKALLAFIRKQREIKADRDVTRFLALWALAFGGLLLALGVELARGRLVLP